MKSFIKEGKKFSSEERKKGLDFSNTTIADDLTPSAQKGQSFNASEAKKQVIHQDNLPVDEYLHDKGLLRYVDFQPADETINRSNQVIEEFNQGIIQEKTESADYTIEKCLQEDAVFDLEVGYALKVKVNHVPEVKRICKICNEHTSKKSYMWKSDAEKSLEKKKQKFADDSTIKSYHVKISGGGMLSDYTVRSQWVHHDDVITCDSYKTEEKILSPQRCDVEDIWSVDNIENELLANSLSCTYISTENLNANEVRDIDGKSISRRCWGKIHKYKCKIEHKKCAFLGSTLCQQIDRQCKQKANSGCALWEITFKCRSLTKQKQIIFNKDSLESGSDDLLDISFTPNASFSEAVTKLKVFDEMKRELENSSYADVARIQVFGGKKSQCSKSVQEDLMYDCCYSFHGLANQLKLSKCTADELSLAEMKEKGLCHYIGSYDEKFLKLWTSRKEHVFCCFPSKLARVLQEEARIQLGLDWGTPENPNCRGLSQEELQKIDFSKLDLSEVYEAPPSIDLSNKIQILEERLKKRIEEMEAV